MNRIPLMLILFRALLVPVMPLLAWHGGTDMGLWLACLLLLGVLSDVFDGIIARRLGCATDGLRRLDSQTDAVFWISALVSITILHSDWVQEQWKWIVLLLAMEGLCYATSLLRFKRETCTHSWLSKAWGVTLCIAFMQVLATGESAVAWPVCIAVGLASQLEVIAILLILPKWGRDIPTLFHAWQLRAKAAA